MIYVNSIPDSIHYNLNVTTVHRITIANNLFLNMCSHINDDCLYETHHDHVVIW